jgi:general secretion pathway protein C
LGAQRNRRFAIAIVLGTLALTALFLAQGVTGLLAATLFELDTSGTAAAPRRRLPSSAASRRKDATPILRRNIFDSETGDLTAVAVAEVEPDALPDQPLDPNAPLPRCDGAVRLVGAFFNTRNREASFAAITGASGKSMLYREGMEVEGRTVVEIGASAVVLRQGAGACQLAMFAPPEAAGGPPPARAVASVSPAAAEEPAGPEREGAITTAEMEAGITRNSDTSFGVARSLVDQLIENQAELMRTARIIPHEEGGRTVGVKLYGIRRNSLLGRLGLQNGDMLRTINGYDMSSPDSALEAYSRLREANNLSVSIVRRGQATTLDYNIQ